MTAYNGVRGNFLLGSALLAASVAAFFPAAAVADPAADKPTIESLCERVFGAIAEPNIRFGLQGHELRTSSYAALDRVINFTRNCPDNVILVIGHSDAIGDERFNLYISLRRAQSVADYLQRGGVKESQLKVAGRGSAEPIADNATRSGRAKNRRIELQLLPQP